MRCRRAFTLVEMLVALAVTSILTILMLKMFSDSSTIWKQHDEKLDTFREARGALQLMARELSTVMSQSGASGADSTAPSAQATVAGNNQFPVLALRERTERTGEVAPDLSPVYFKKAFALASIPNSGKSVLCSVGYYLDWDVTPNAYGESRNAYILKRQQVDSDFTFNRLKVILKGPVPLTGPAAFAALHVPNDLSTDGVQSVATYIWDLQFCVPATTPNPKGAGLPPIQTIASTSDAFFGRELPQWVEIRFRALGSAAASKLYGQPITPETWADPSLDLHKRFILPSEQQFVTRVKLAR